jgi:Tol biopolymer transport system component
MNCRRTDLIIVLVIIFKLSSQQAYADFIFGTPRNCGPAINTASYGEYGPSISSDGLTLYFADGAKWPYRPFGLGGGDIWVTTRETLDDEWQTSINIGAPINTSALEGTPFISANGLSIYFTSNRFGGIGETDLYVSTRPSLDAPWEEPLNLGVNVNSNSVDGFPYVSNDGLILYFASFRLGKGDIFRATRNDTSESFGPAQNIGMPISTPDGDEGTPWISPDGHTLFFTKLWGGSYDIFISRRLEIDEAWGTPVNLGPPVSIPKPGDESGGSFTADGTRFFFHGDHTGGYGHTDIWEAEVIPIVDLNGDGIVDAADMCIIVDNWGTDNQLCDIGPMPWGDGVVDVHDLVVLAEHLFEETTPIE